MERIRFSLSRAFLKMLAAASGIAAYAFLLVACNGNSSGKSDVDNLPFQGEWHKPGAEHTLDISYSRIQFIDRDDMNPILVFAPYSPETPDNPDRLTFLYNDNYPGTVVYDRSKQSVTLTIKGLMDDGSDYVITFDPSDRLDRITPYVGAEYRLIYSYDDKSPIDTLYRGESVRWVDDTLKNRRVQLRSLIHI